MTEQLVTLETALLAREKSFNVHCDWRYVEENAQSQHEDSLVNWKDERVKEFFKDVDANSGYHEHYSKYLRQNYNDTFDNDDIGYYVSAPTQAHLQMWLRDVHKIHIELQYSFKEKSSDVEWWFYLYPVIGGGRQKFFPHEIGEGLDYEGALEQGLIEALKLI